MTDQNLITNELLDFLDANPSTPRTPALTEPSPALRTSLEPLEMDTLMPLAREPVVISRVLQKLPKSRRPPEEIACCTCPSAMWITGATEVRAYCHTMKLISWSADTSDDLTACDGREAAIASLAERQ